MAVFYNAYGSVLMFMAIYDYVLVDIFNSQRLILL